jgi:spermidine synthase
MKILEEVKSVINGKIRVVKSLGCGTYIQVDNLTQSGGVVYEVWRSTLHKIKNKKSKIKNCLILGLGGGSAAKLVRKYWPEAKITGVEIDPVMIDLGKKYLGLADLNIDLKIQDAFEFCLKGNTQKTKYDLILVDIYVGYDVPEKFESDKFLKPVLRLLSSDGLIVFNRLYFGEKRRLAEIFHRKLIHIFKKVRPIYPEANVMYVCRLTSHI